MTKNGKTTTLDLNNYAITKNGHTYYMAGFNMSEGFILYKDHAYLESAVFSETFGVIVQYDAQGKSVTIKPANENQISITTMKLNFEDEYLNSIRSVSADRRA